MKKLSDGVIQGSRICLRPMQAIDINERYLSWFQDQVVNEFLQAKNITYQAALSHFNQGVESEKYFLYIIENKMESIGVIKLGLIESIYNISDISIVIGQREYWGQGIATEALQLVKYLAFDVHKIRKLYAGMIDGNIRSVKAFIKAGFSVEARLKAHIPHNREFKDRIVLSCFNPE